MELPAAPAEAAPAEEGDTPGPSGANPTTNLHNNPFSKLQAQTAPEAGIELLAALAEEGDALGPSRRGAAVAALAQRAPEVLALVGALASEPGDQ